MREDHKRLRACILQQLENNGLRHNSKAAKQAEYFMIVGYLTMQAEIEEKLDPYLTTLAMSGRRLTEEKVA